MPRRGGGRRGVGAVRKIRSPVDGPGKVSEVGGAAACKGDLSAEEAREQPHHLGVIVDGDVVPASICPMIPSINSLEFMIGVDVGVDVVVDDVDVDDVDGGVDDGIDVDVVSSSIFPMIPSNID